MTTRQLSIRPTPFRLGWSHVDVVDAPIGLEDGGHVGIVVRPGDPVAPDACVQPRIAQVETPPVQRLQPTHVAHLRGIRLGVHVSDENCRKAALFTTSQNQLPQCRDLALPHPAVVEPPVEMRAREAEGTARRLDRQRSARLPVASVGQR